MAEKKTTKKEAAAKTTATKKTTTVKKTCAKKATVAVTAEKAGDVYQTLAATGSAMSICEIAKAAKISEEEVLLGAGWLFKEGKIVSVEDKVTLA